MTKYPLLLALLLLVGCDSTSQMTVKRSLPMGATINATESITVTGSSTTIAFQFVRNSLPDDLVSGGHPQVALGGHPVPLMAAGPSVLQATLPPQTMPPTPDLNGDTVLLFQSDRGSRLIPTHLNVQH